MKQLTIRGFDEQLERKIRSVAREQGISLNQAVLRLLKKGAGLETAQPADVVGASLEHLFGTWTDDEARQVMEAVADFERIDEDMWR